MTASHQFNHLMLNTGENVSLAFPYRCLHSIAMHNFRMQKH